MLVYLGLIESSVDAEKPNQHIMMLSKHGYSTRLTLVVVEFKSRKAIWSLEVDAVGNDREHSSSVNSDCPASTLYLTYFGGRKLVSRRL